jgi:predicted XRE-type DNA-binding protein
MNENVRMEQIVTEEGEEIAYEVGGDNVFADLDLPEAEELLAKAQLVRAIGRAIAQRSLTQRQASELLGIKQPEVSRLLRGHTTGYSSDRLMQYLTRLNRDVRITVEPSRDDGRGRVSVLVAE